TVVRGGLPAVDDRGRRALGRGGGPRRDRAPSDALRAVLNGPGGRRLGEPDAAPETPPGRYACTPACAAPETPAGWHIDTPAPPTPPAPAARPAPPPARYACPPACASASSTTLLSSIARVIGPAPPGTGAR